MKTHKEALISLLREDMTKEYQHMNFYLYSSMLVKGDYGVVRNFLIDEASSEMEHVRQFGDIIIGLGGSPINPTDLPLAVPSLSSPQEIFEFALKLETEVTDNYAIRVKQAEEFGGTDGVWVQIFYENQLQDSRQDLDRIRMMMR